VHDGEVVELAGAAGVDVAAGAVTVVDDGSDRAVGAVAGAVAGGMDPLALLEQPVARRTTPTARILFIVA
jgi:hypothetical protein